MAIAYRAVDQIIDESGRPVVAGFIYYGLHGQDPKLNPISIYADEDLTTPLDNPLRTDILGRPTATPHLNQDYSYEITSIFGDTIEGPVNVRIGANSLGLSATPLSFASVADLRALKPLGSGSLAPVLLIGSTAITQSYYAGKSGGAATYHITTVAAERMRRANPTWVPDGYADHYVGGSTVNVAVLQLSGVAFPEQFGAHPSQPPVVNSSALQAAFNTLLPVEFGAGEFSFNAGINYHCKGLKGQGRENTILRCVQTGTFLIRQVSEDINPIRDFYAIGPGRTTAGSVFMGHAGNSRGWFRTNVARVRVGQFETCFEIQLSLNITFDTVYIRDVNNGFIFKGPTTPGSPGWNGSGPIAWYNNIVTFTNLIVVFCYGYGIDFKGTNLTLINPLIQDTDKALRISGGSSPSDTNQIINWYSEQNFTYDIELNNTKLTLHGAVVLNAVGGEPGITQTQDAFRLNNSTLYETCPVTFRDVPANARKLLQNGSKWISLAEYKEDVLNIIDATSKYLSVTTFVEDYVEPRKTTVTNPVGGTAYAINNGQRMLDGAVEVYLSTPAGGTSSLIVHGGLTSTGYRMNATGFKVANVTDTQFTVTLAGSPVLTFTGNTANGAVTVTPSTSASGDLVITVRRISPAPRQPAS